MLLINRIYLQNISNYLSFLCTDEMTKWQKNITSKSVQHLDCQFEMSLPLISNFIQASHLFKNTVTHSDREY